MWTTILILVTFDFNPHNLKDRSFSGRKFSKFQNMDSRWQIANEGISQTDCQSGWNIIPKALILNED